MPRKELNEATRNCTIHRGKTIHRIQFKKKPTFIRKIKYLIERKAIDFDFNSLQAEKANAFSILRIFNWRSLRAYSAFFIISKHSWSCSYGLLYGCKSLQAPSWMGTFILYINLFYFNWGSIENWSNIWLAYL